MSNLKSVFVMINLPLVLILCSSLFVQGCATPTEKFIDAAKQLDFSNQLVTGLPYQHRLFSNSQASRSEIINELHVYLDGDGTPWQTETRIAGDPTSRNPLILEMMAKDPAASVLLGRPCYYGLNLSSLCDGSLWTSRRYSAEVVASMGAALRQGMASKKVNHLVLIGYSGGGVLATLLAAHLKETSVIITIAANLDTEAWGLHHGYSAPAASLNPAKDAHIPANVRQIHLAGLQDENVPATLIESFCRTQENTTYLPLPKYDHLCCWLEIWPSILKTKLGQ